MLETISNEACHVPCKLCVAGVTGYRSQHVRKSCIYRLDWEVRDDFDRVKEIMDTKLKEVWRTGMEFEGVLDSWEIQWQRHNHVAVVKRDHKRKEGRLRHQQQVTEQQKHMTGGRYISFTLRARVFK